MSPEVVQAVVEKAEVQEVAMEMEVKVEAKAVVVKEVVWEVDLAGCKVVVAAKKDGSMNLAQCAPLCQRNLQ